MIIATVPPAAVGTLRTALQEFVAGLGGSRLEQMKVNTADLRAQGALAEARLDLAGVARFLDSNAESFDTFFDRLQVFLLEEIMLVGSVGLAKSDQGGLVVDHVTLGGVQEIVDGLLSAEALPESQDSEARLLRVPAIYLTALVLVRNRRADFFLVLSPPYAGVAGKRTPEEFGAIVSRLIGRHGRLFRG